MDRVLFVRNEDRVPDIKKLETMFGVEWMPLGDEVTKKKFILKEQRAKKKSLSAEGCIGILETQWPNGNPTKGGPSKYYSLWRVTPYDKADDIRAYLSDPDTYIEGTRREIPPDGRKIAFLYIHDRNRPKKEKKAPVPATSESFADAPTSGDDLKDSCVNALNTWKATDEQREKDYNSKKLEMQTLRDYLKKSSHLDVSVQFSKPWFVPWEGSTNTKYGSYRWKYQWKQGTAYDSTGKGYPMTKWDKNGGLNSGGEHLKYQVLMLGTHCDGGGRDHQDAELRDPINKKAAADILNKYAILYDSEKFNSLKKYIDFTDSFTLPNGMIQKVMFKPFAGDDLTLYYRRMAERECGSDEPVDVIQASKTSQRIDLEKTWMQDIESEIAKNYVASQLKMQCNNCIPTLTTTQTGGTSRDNQYQQILTCLINSFEENRPTTNNNPSVNQDPSGADPREVDDDDDDNIDILGQKVDTSTAFFGGALSSLSSCCLCIVLIVIFFMMRN